MALFLKKIAQVKLMTHLNSVSSNPINQVVSLSSIRGPQAIVVSGYLDLVNQFCDQQIELNPVKRSKN